MYYSGFLCKTGMFSSFDGYILGENGNFATIFE